MTNEFIEAMKQAIVKHLPDDVHEIAQKFTIPIEFIEKMPDLITLVLTSRSMKEQSEKQSWFNLLPLMTDDQIEKLEDILTRERKKLDAIEQKYEKKKLEIKKKYLARWQNMNYIKKMDVLKESEEKSKKQDEQDAESLLDNL